MTHAEYADGLRQVADFLEAHPEIELPENTLNCYRLFDKKVAAVVAAAMSKGGRANKEWSDSLFTISREFGPITLKYMGTRSNICERVIVGKVAVPEQKVPARPAEEAHTIPAHEEPLYEWRCTPLLMKPSYEVEGDAPALTASEPLALEAENVDIPF